MALLKSGERAKPAFEGAVLRFDKRNLGFPGVSSILRDTIRKLAKVGSPVLIISGETGAGKELVAQAIHASSPRAGSRYRVVNCATVPEPLLEGERSESAEDGSGGNSRPGLSRLSVDVCGRTGKAGP